MKLGKIMVVMSLLAVALGCKTAQEPVQAKSAAPLGVSIDAPESARPDARETESQFDLYEPHRWSMQTGNGFQ